MSQVSIVDIVGNNPQIATRYNANSGFAIPLANTLEIYGNTVLAGTNPVRTVATGNNVTTYVQISQAIAASNLLRVGLSAFNSAHFIVDAAGFVSIDTSGFVLTVSGTSNRITSTGGSNPVIDIAATYVGQTSLKTLGTVTTGTWNATVIATTVGGTGLTSYAQGDLVYASATNVLSKLPKNVTATRYLANTGTSNNPTWAQITLTTGITGVLPIANGGTNASSFATSNGIIKYNGTALATSTATIDASNRYQNSAQPGVGAWLFNTNANVTGDGTVYTPIFDQAPFNQGGNYSSATGIFTAPIVGIYSINFTVTLSGLTALHTSLVLVLDIVGAGSDANRQIQSAPFVSAVSGVNSFTLSAIMKLNTAQTLTPKVQVSGSTLTVNLMGASSGRVNSSFYCIQIC